MTQATDERITKALDKLHTLLQYSCSDKADGVLRIINEAKTIWEDNEEEYNDNEGEELN